MVITLALALTLTQTLIQAGAMIGEAVNGIRTVATLTLEKRLVANYLAGLEDTWAEEHKAAMVGGFASGYSEFIFMGVDALLFYVGALMVDAGTSQCYDGALVQT
jgi:ATP-binding cassette subfamily B (MDR/TAP) protein 1